MCLENPEFLPFAVRAQAEEEHAAMLLQAGDDARRRQCLSRTRGESVAALANFLPALRKRLFLAVDVTGPVSRRECRYWYCLE